MKRTNIPSYLAHKLGILVALGVLVMIAVMASQRAPAITHAAPQPTLSVDVLQTGKPFNGCPVVKETKCTLNLGDTFAVQIKINDFAGLSNANYGDWDAHLTFNGVTFKTASIPSGACSGLGAKTHSTSGTGVDDVTCSNSNGTSNSALLATANFNCAASGTLALTQVHITDDGHTITLPDPSAVPPAPFVAKVTINCGETAKMGLEMKSTINPPGMLVNATFDVGIKLSDLKLKDANGNGTAGYRAWQARVNFGAGLVLQSPAAVTFNLPSSPITAQSLATGTALLGATVNTGVGETNAQGNLANLHFKCTSPGIWTITLKGTSETFLVSEKQGQPTLTVAPASIQIDCRAAVMSIGVKAGSKTSQGNTYWVYQGQKFTVSVAVDQLSKLTYDEARARITYDGTNLSYQSTDFLNPPCPTAGTATASATQVDVSCSTTIEATNSSFAGGNIFNLVFNCVANNASGINDVTLQLVDDGTGEQTGLLDKTSTWRNAFFSKDSVTIHCVGLASDKDKDGCTVAQELAFVPALNPNVPDYWDTNGDDRIDIRDVLAYVKAFGQKPSGTVLNTNGGIPPIIDINDILNVIKLYGTNCK